MADSTHAFDPAVFARLARLELTEEERVRYAREFETLLRYFGAVAQADTAGVAPMLYPVEQGLRTRPDAERDAGMRDAILGNAPPPRSEEFFRVPKVIES